MFGLSGPLLIVPALPRATVEEIPRNACANNGSLGSRNRLSSQLLYSKAHAADRAESGAYDMAGTPKAKMLAKERAKRLYDLASRLESARTDRRA